jgi:hypothetical protein
MARPLLPRVLAALNIEELTDAELHETVGSISTASATSALVKNNPPMAASVTLLVTKDGTLVAANKTVSDDRTKLKSDLGTEALARAAVQGELRTYLTYASNLAQNVTDLHGAGLNERGPRAPRGTVPPVPGGIDIRPPVKGHGRVRVAVHEGGSTRLQYVAEQSADGVTWSPLGTGRGKTRMLSGTSGTKIWVRFASVRGQLQSDFCAGVQVTIP